MNSVSLIGNTTGEIKIIPFEKNGKQMKVGNFTLAVHDIGNQATDFIACTAFNRQAEIIEEYVKKGEQIGIEGKIKSSSYVKNGVKCYKTYVKIKEVTLIGGRKSCNQTEECTEEEFTDISSEELMELFSR